MFPNRCQNETVGTCLLVCSAARMNTQAGGMFDPMRYSWPVIIYLSDYFVNYLSIELLIQLHDLLYIIYDLI